MANDSVREYGYRWVMLVVFMLVVAANQLRRIQLVSATLEIGLTG